MDELLRAADVHSDYGIPIETLKSWRRRGHGPAWQYAGPRRVVYRRSVIEAWLAAEAARTAERAS